MKISLILKNIITYTSISYRPPNLHSQNLPSFEIEISDFHSTNVNVDLPINYHTIKNMMLMSYNAYMEPDDSKWEKVEFNNTIDISLDPNDIQAYLFSDDTKKFNVIAIKGTSISYIPMFLSALKSPAPHDKYNDNLFFSCCFYKQSKLFRDTCDDTTT